MALTFTFTPTAPVVGATIEFIENAVAPGRYARALDPGGPIADLKKFRPTGADGSLIVRGGQIGRKITVGVRYIGSTIDIAVAAAHEDLGLFSTRAYDIVCLGKTYVGCNLVPGSAKMSLPYMPTGRTDGHTYFDIVMMFSEDQP